MYNSFIDHCFCQCPIYDLISNVDFTESYQTVTTHGGIIVRRETFEEDSFAVVVVVLPDDYKCNDTEAKRNTVVRKLSLIYHLHQMLEVRKLKSRYQLVISVPPYRLAGLLFLEHVQNWWADILGFNANDLRHCVLQCARFVSQTPQPSLSYF